MPPPTHDLMSRLADEVVLQIISYLSVVDLVHLQLVSTRYLNLARDSESWKTICFENSRAEESRRRQRRRQQRQTHREDARLAELRNAVTALPGGDLTAWDVSQLVGRGDQRRAAADPQAEARTQRSRALANWEPGYPGEHVDYYAEYIHRYAPISTAWLTLPRTETADKDSSREATGVGLLATGDRQHVVAPLDDGSICIWDISRRHTTVHSGGGKLLAQTKSGLLTGQTAAATVESHNIMTETGAVECVATDSTSRKAYFAVQTHLHEVDLNTLQLVSTKQYPWPITALSEARHNVPITVGTSMTIHLQDPRDPAFAAADTPSVGELIGGSLYSHATLAQPGPLSILHDAGGSAADGSIWVAGRFTSLLNYDRRFFPRLRGTIFSGARVANLSMLDRPFIPRHMDLLRNPDASLSALQEARAQSGTTIVAAAEYKGKGSLELYGLPARHSYQNRQTASASKLLSVAPHGARLVFSDGDGNLKWVERDGFSHVRTFNINDSAPATDATTYGIWSSAASELPGHGDIVQKIIPTAAAAVAETSSTADFSRADINQENLVLWTGDGRLGLLGFGPGAPFAGDEGWHDALEQQAQSTEARAREDAERQYGLAMRRALERDADGVRIARRLGMMRS